MLDCLFFFSKKRKSEWNTYVRENSSILRHSVLLSRLSDSTSWILRPTNTSHPNFTNTPFSALHLRNHARTVESLRGRFHKCVFQPITSNSIDWPHEQDKEALYEDASSLRDLYSETTVGVKACGDVMIGQHGQSVHEAIPHICGAKAIPTSLLLSSSSPRNN